MKLPGRDLVAERLAGLGDAERRLLARGVHHVDEVEEDALRRLRPQVVQTRLVLDHAEVGLEHAVERTGLGPRAAGAAVGARDGGEVDVVGIVDALLLRDRLLQVVGAEPLVAALALGQRVGERRQVARCLPRLGRQDHRRVEADHVVARRDHGAPPLALDVLLELDAERTVVPGGAGASVDLSTGEDETPAFTQADDLVDGRRGHGFSPSGWRSVVNCPSEAAHLGYLAGVSAARLGVWLRWVRSRRRRRSPRTPTARRSRRDSSGTTCSLMSYADSARR